MRVWLAIVLGCGVMTIVLSLIAADMPILIFVLLGLGMTATGIILKKMIEKAERPPN